MDQEYAEIYRSLYTTFHGVSEGPAPSYYWRGSIPPAPRVDNAIQRAISEAELSLYAGYKLRLRDDARFLLLLNLSEMIARPLLVNGAADDYFQSGVAEDVQRVVETAAQQHRRNANDDEDEGSISARGVIDALSNSWQDLAVGKTGLWRRTPTRDNG